MRRTLGTVLLATCLVAGGEAAAQESVPAELVVRAARIHTLDPARPLARSLAIRGGRIAALAEGDPPASWSGPETKQLDLGETCLVPGLWDAHGHPLSLGLARRKLDLSATRSFAQVLERVAARARETPPGEWILGRGWDQNDWPPEEFAGELPSHARLSAATPAHPVLLTRVDGHAVLVNARALALSGIDAATSSPPGGEILHDAAGQPTGVLVDAAMGRIRVPPPSARQLEEALLLAQDECFRAGLVGVQAAGVGLEALAATKRLYRAGTLKMRTYAMLTPEAARDHYLARGPELGLFEGRLTVRAIKYFMDGALGSRGAHLLAPYSDRPDTRGLPQLSVEELAEATRAALASGFQVCTHAIGDAGVRAVLDAYAQALREDAGDFRLRVEHAQVIAPDDLPRFAALGVLPSMQPTHATSDAPWAEARLGPERVRGAYAWQSLLRAGVRHLPLGSDFPVESPRPLLGIYAATTRCDPAGHSPHGPAGWFPEQALSRERALLGFTRDACYAAFLEQEGGRLAPGRWADLSGFDRDILTCEPAELLQAQTRCVIVQGEVVYQALK